MNHFIFARFRVSFIIKVKQIHQDFFFFLFKPAIFPFQTSSCLHKSISGWFRLNILKFSLICILPTKQNTPKDNKRCNRSGAVKHLSRLKQAAFYPRAITIMNTGRTIRHTALLLQAATVVCFFSLSLLSSECP